MEWWFPGARGKTSEELSSDGYRFLVWEEEKILAIDGSDCHNGANALMSMNCKCENG